MYTLPSHSVLHGTAARRPPRSTHSCCAPAPCHCCRKSSRYRALSFTPIMYAVHTWRCAADWSQPCPRSSGRGARDCLRLLTRARQHRQFSGTPAATHLPETRPPDPRLHHLAAGPTHPPTPLPAQAQSPAAELHCTAPHRLPTTKPNNACHHLKLPPHNAPLGSGHSHSSSLGRSWP